MVLLGITILKTQQTWLRLFLEETLLKYHDAFSDNTNFYYSIRKRFSILLVDVYIQGESLNVLRPEVLKNTDSNILDNMFANKGDGEVIYKYRDNENIISVSLPIESKKIKIPGSKNLHAIVLGVLVGFLLKHLLSPTSVTTLVDSYVSPIYSSLMGALKGLMESVIFISLVVGICAIEDLRSLSTIGMATPRIPGGIIASCTIMFSQLGLTTDQLGIIMAANVLVLYLDTAVAAITRCCCAINSAKKQGYIDLDILKNPNIY